MALPVSRPSWRLAASRRPGARCLVQLGTRRQAHKRTQGSVTSSLVKVVLTEGRGRPSLAGRMEAMQFACFCGRPLQFVPSIHNGFDSYGHFLKAGHCSEDGWVGSDGKNLAVPVTPMQDDA